MNTKYRNASTILSARIKRDLFTRRTENTRQDQRNGGTHTVQRFLARQKRTAPGPDGLLHWMWRDFSHLLAPVITKLFNRSLQEQFVPCHWKLANVTPIPKETPLTNCNQLRPISLTNIIIRLFEKLILKFELFHVLKSLIGPDQLAYKENSNTTMALLKSQHYWMKWLDGNANFVRVLSFDFSKAFDTVSHYILSDKLKATNINPYVINWILDFLNQRKQRVVVDGITTEFIDINRGVPQGTVLGPILFSLMVNDIQLADPRRNLLVKFADDITISIPVSKDSTDATINEVNSIGDWAASNRMTLNLSKTWEMLIHGKTTKPNPQPVPDIERKSWLKLLGIIFQENPCCWDLHVDKLIAKASSRPYILRVCKFYGYSQDQLNKLFDSLILSLFAYGLEVWGSASKKYLDRIDSFCKRAYRYGYTAKADFEISTLIEERDKLLFDKIATTKDHPLQDLLPPKRSRMLRKRGHEFQLPQIRTERYKNSFMNRCLFKFV